MKKIIDIPDEIVKELKVMAVRNDTDLKNYIQNLIAKHYEFSNVTEMASYAVEDGQSMRFIWNYLVQTFQGIQDETFDCGDFKFESLIDFLEYVKHVCETAINSIKMDDEDYERNN